MAEDLNIYTGQLRYRDIDFMFVFNGENLQLIPPKDNRHEIEMNWLMTPLGNGVYTMGEPLYMEEAYLVGKCNETARTIVFLTKQGKSIGSYNAVLIVELSAYIICKYDRPVIDKMSFTSPEINCIHPVNQAFSCSVDFETYSSNGVITLTTKDFGSTTTEMQEFIVDEKNVKVYFDVTRTVSYKIGVPPLSLNSSIVFEFDATDDYIFIYRLWQIAKEFVRFLCYRNNTLLPTAELSAPYEGGKHEKFATFYAINESADKEPDTLKKGRYIKQQYIAGYEGKILSDIAANLIYLRHLPETYLSGRHIDAARFVMITAAFEWEFRRAYPNGVPKKESTLKAENEAIGTIQNLCESSKGKLKQIYNFLRKLIKSDSLQSEIIQIGKDFDDIVGVFGHHLYKLNNENLVYSEMGQRLAAQRNHFAHGDLDKDFIGLSLLDLIFLEYAIYAMQLKFYGVDDKNIQRAINDLFHCGIVIPDT